MNTLKRFTASAMLGLALTLGGVQSAAAQCYDVYRRVATWYGADGSVIEIYEYQGTLCLEQ